MTALPPLREVIATHGLAADKALGQHFLLDTNLIDRIARTALHGVAGPCTVLEIGPGPGGLTRALLAHDNIILHAIEKDPRCRPILEELAAARSGLRVHTADALTMDPRSLTPPPTRIAANLPYNVATPLLVGWVKSISCYERITVMVQREVADRLAANPGGKDYGRLGVLAGAVARVRKAFDVHPGAFVPPPKVWSAVVVLEPLAEQPSAPVLGALERVTAAAFGQRRKMLRSSLKPLGDVDALCVAAGLDPQARAETIPVAGFLKLANLLV